jgi:hypothetical protein
MAGEGAVMSELPTGPGQVPLRPPKTGGAGTTCRAPTGFAARPKRVSPHGREVPVQGAWNRRKDGEVNSPLQSRKNAGLKPGRYKDAQNIWRDEIAATTKTAGLKTRHYSKSGVKPPHSKSARPPKMGGVTGVDGGDDAD